MKKVLLLAIFAFLLVSHKAFAEDCSYIKNQLAGLRLQGSSEYSQSVRNQISGLQKQLKSCEAQASQVQYIQPSYSNAAHEEVMREYEEILQELEEDRERLQKEQFEYEKMKLEMENKQIKAKPIPKAIVPVVEKPPIENSSLIPDDAVVTPHSDYTKSWFGRLIDNVIFWR